MQKSVLWRKHGLVLFNPQIGPISGATTPGQSGPGSNGNKGVLHILQSSSIIGTSPSDCLVSYRGHSLRGGGLTPLQRSSQCILQPKSIGQCVFMRVRWKVHKLTQILWWKVTKWDLFFNIISLPCGWHTFFHRRYSAWIPLIKKGHHQQQIWCQPMNFSAQFCIYLTHFVPIYLSQSVCIYNIHTFLQSVQNY